MLGNAYVLLRRRPQIRMTCAVQCPPKSHKVRQGAGMMCVHSNFADKVMTSELEECPMSMCHTSFPGLSRISRC